MAQYFLGLKALSLKREKRYPIIMKRQNLYIAVIFAAVCLLAGQAAFAQKNLGRAVRRLANSKAEQTALADMFKASSVVKNSSKKAGKNLSKAAAFVEENPEVLNAINKALTKSQGELLSSYKVDTRVFLTDKFRAHFSASEGNPIVFLNISHGSSLGAMELFNKLGNVMNNRRMYIQTQEGGLVVLFKNYSKELNADLEELMKAFALSGKYNFVQAANLRTNMLYLFSSNGKKAIHPMTETDLVEFSRVLGRDMQPGRTFRPLTPAAKLKAIRFMQHNVLANDPSAAMVVLENRGVVKLAGQFPVRQAVLVKVTTPFVTQDLTNTIWNRASGDNLNWEQQVFFQNGDFGDDLLLQTAVDNLFQALKYNYRLIVHSSR